MGDGFDPCAGVVYMSDYTWIFVGVACGLSLILLCICFFYFRRRKAARLPENNPNFAPASGELNHSMDLLEKAFSPNRNIPTTQLPSETEALNKNLTDDEDDSDEHFED